MSGYRLDDQAVKVQTPAGAEDFFISLCAQTGSETHPASYPLGTGGPFPRVKAPLGCDADHSPPSNADVMNEWDLYLLCLHRVLWDCCDANHSPTCSAKVKNEQEDPCHLHRSSGTAFLYIYIYIYP
jgi:hypothetical protein